MIIVVTVFLAFAITVVYSLHTNSIKQHSLLMTITVIIPINCLFII